MGRSYGILKHAYSMHSKEALNLLSLAKLGCDLGFYPEEQRHAVDELFMETQPAHLQKGSQQKLAAEERDALRATIIRQKLASCPEPDVLGVLERTARQAGTAPELDDKKEGGSSGEAPQEGLI
jgi:protein arginine kinase